VLQPTPEASATDAATAEAGPGDAGVVAADAGGLTPPVDAAAGPGDGGGAATPPADAGAAPTAEPTPEQQRQARRLAVEAAMTAERNPEQALAMARQASELDPQAAMAWYVIGFVENGRGNVEEARTALDRCVAARGEGQSDCRLLLRRLGQ
jgi:tetratricopeptide (TPR) repeat protein